MIIDHGKVPVSYPLLRAADSIKHQNYKTYESAKGFVCKISPMRNGRFRLMDYVQNVDEYFSHDQLEQLHNAAMKIVSSAPKKT